VQEVWLGVTADLSSVVSNIQEIFSLGIPEVAAVQAIIPDPCQILQSEKDLKGQ
jgi:hypothetical protein